MTPSDRKKVIDATKQSIPPGARGTREAAPAHGSLLASLVMARELGFKKAEVMAMVQEEWLHLTEIDNKTVKGASK